MAKRGKKGGGTLFDGDDGEVIDGGTPPGDSGGPEAVALHEAAQTRYLNYALSVITSRALPDVRDGLKPVQRRILYTMWQQNLTADAKHRKCAKVVGDVMGNYHPHGDSALYETLVRMAQPFSLRYPLISGSGNFGSLDGDSAAAMRYTECRLARLSDEILTEIEQTTVPFRPNYDGTRTEPVVLPSRIPNLLINGATGIAVGMATNIPPHNLNEICTALIKLLDNADLTSAQLCRYVKGPDFPTGGEMLNSPEELKEIYKTGSGAVRVRATWEEGPVTRSGKTIYITSIPYAMNKAAVVRAIADVALSRKLPPLVDVTDVSTDDVRIALELKKDADEKMVMAYLFKHTPLQSSFIVNLTCLVPTEGNPEVGRPERLDLHQMLFYFLHFRLDVVTRRLEHELASLRKRVHILEGFEKVFDALDEILKIVRKSDGKADAAQQIVKRFPIDDDQADAILELKIYRLARLEILIVRKELEDKRRRIRQINTLLKDEQSRWDIVRVELEEIQKKYGDARRTIISSDAGESEYTAEDFIVEEDNVVIVSRDGWVKRQKEVKEVASTRVREGDAVMAVLPGQHAILRRVLQQLRRGLYLADYRDPGLDRLWRTDSALLQAEGRRADSRGVQPRPPRRRADRAEKRRRGAAGARRRRVERRLQPAVQPRALRRAEHARRAAVRESGQGGGVRRRVAGDGRRDPDSRHPGGARDPVPGRRGEFPVRPRPRSDPDQAVVRRRQSAGIRRVDGRSRSADGRNEPRRRTDDQHHEVRGHGPRRQGPRAPAARPVHEGRVAAARSAAAAVRVSNGGRFFDDDPWIRLDDDSSIDAARPRFASRTARRRVVPLPRAERLRALGGHRAPDRVRAGPERDLEDRPAAGILLADRARQSDLPDRVPGGHARELRRGSARRGKCCGSARRRASGRKSSTSAIIRPRPRLPRTASASISSSPTTGCWPTT